MTQTKNPPNYLDPQDWDAFRHVLHMIVDDVTDHLQDQRSLPVWQKPTDAVRENFSVPLPKEGIGLEATYHRFRRDILPHLVGNIHPRFWGWVVGSNAPSSMVGEWLAAFTNGVPTIFDDSSLLTEMQVLDWIKTLFGYDEKASAVLTTGASESTLLALVAARYAMLGPDTKQHGIQSTDLPPRFYISDQTHHSSLKAIEILGFGRDAIRVIPSDENYAMCVDALERAIFDDRDAGFNPMVVIGTLGTVNTGASDDLEAIARLCGAYNIWLHVDGAFGAWAVLSQSKKHLAARIRDGIRFGDSLAFDMHKWMYQSYDIGCVLVRNGDAHREALRAHAGYLTQIEGTLSDSGESLSDLSVQLSRGFRALRFWFSLTSDGADAFGQTIDQTLELAQYLTGKVEAHDRLELLAPTALHIVNFRYRNNTLSSDELNQVNHTIFRHLHETGFAIPSSIELGNAFSIRTSISNHRTSEADLDEYVTRIVAHGDALTDV